MLPLDQVRPTTDENYQLNELTYLRQRMRKPQRHRLLHGYPLAAAMPSGSASDDYDDVLPGCDPTRGLLVGVLPHPFCNPTVAGCGFCTFPHQKFNAEQASDTIAHVVREIEERVQRQPGLQGRRVLSVYFGGGTANLAPAEPFRQLCRTLARTFDCSEAEITLEGVPAYFIKRKPLLVDILHEEIPARHFRISMGVQTLNEERLRSMGRLHFGTAETFQQVVDFAHQRGMTISADLLFNLPHQSLAEMQTDLAQAINLGLDHVGLYHLVLFRGLGTAWAKDEEMLAGLPDNTRSAEHWLALQAQLVQAGFRQTTLTNFERREFHGQPTRFVYEEHSFHADRFDMIGFGPGGISFAADRQFVTGRKTINPDDALAYIQAIEKGGPSWDRVFDYSPGDLRVFYLTRRLALLSISRDEYQQRFESDVLTDFAEEFAAMLEAQLVTLQQDTITVTPLGMFYADSLAALLARRALDDFRLGGGWPWKWPWERKPKRKPNDNGHGFM